MTMLSVLAQRARHRLSARTSRLCQQKLPNDLDVLVDALHVAGRYCPSSRLRFNVSGQSDQQRRDMAGVNRIAMEPAEARIEGAMAFHAGKKPECPKDWDTPVRQAWYDGYYHERMKWFVKTKLSKKYR